MEFDTAVTELEALVGTLERERDERALLALELVDAIHRPALERIAAGELDHPYAQALLAMYGFAPLEEHLQVLEALDEVRPSIHAAGGEVQLIEVEDGVVRLALLGDPLDTATSESLTRHIEAALRQSYPDFKELVTEEPEGTSLPLAQSGAAPAEAEAQPTALPQAPSGGPALAEVAAEETSLPQAASGGSPLPQVPSGASPLPQMPSEGAAWSGVSLGEPRPQVRPLSPSGGGASPPQGPSQHARAPQAKVLHLEDLDDPKPEGLKRPVFADVARTDEIPPGELRAVMAGETSVLLVNVEGEIYGFKNLCPFDNLPLEGARLTNSVIVCPWMNCAYDARSGKRVDGVDEPGLAVVPVRLEDGAVRVAVDAR